MKKLILAILYQFLIPIYLFAQMKHDNTWLFNVYLGQKGDTVMQLKFNPEPTISYQTGGATMYLMNASYSNKYGDLQFYTNGCVIMDKNHQIITGGDSINFGSNQWGDCLQGYGYAEGPQSAIFLPKPEHEDSIINLYHLFGEGVFDPILGLNYYTFEIRNTEISKIANKWKVTNKNITIIRDTLSSKGMIATKHVNNKDWWIVIPDESGSNTRNTYNILKITKDGASEIKKQKIGDLLTGTQQCNFSPDGSKYALYNWVETYVSLFDFDRATGTLNNYRKFNLPDTNRFGGCAFSPNSRFLYVTQLDKIWQYDIYASDIDASRELVAVYDGFIDPSYDTTKTKKRSYFWQMQQGPDCKIYINAPPLLNRYLSYINKPNEKGVACDVRQHAIQFKLSYNATMPYFPNYRLGTIYENDCDTITGVGWLNPYLENDALEIVPNPSQGSFEVRNLDSENETSLEIYNTFGNLIYSHKIEKNTSSIFIDSLNIKNGLYFILQKDIKKNIRYNKFIILN